MKTKFLCLAMVFLALTQSGYGQSGCLSSYCSRDTLQIKSGFDHRKDTLYVIGQQDAYFELTGAPTGVSINVPAFVITPHAAWYTLPNTQWISAHNNTNYNVNNPVPDPPYIFETCFCTCQDDSAFINLKIGADDIVEVKLDGVSLGNYTAGYYFQSANTININHATYLAAGTHCIQLELRNTGGVAMGINVAGTVVGGFTLNHVCCDPSGDICGVKYEDVNGNGQRDAGEPGLENWEIILEDSLGNPIDTILTDIHGDYCFTHLTSGNYHVREVAQPWWNQMEPDSSGKWSFYLDSLEIETANFGNQRCEVTLRDSLKLGTGYNAELDTVYVDNDEDMYWTVISDPWGNDPYPAIAAYTNSAYQPEFPDTRWINYPHSQRPSGAPVNGTYSFERCFCLAPGFTDASLDINLRADDSARVFFNGHNLGITLLNPSSFGNPVPTNLKDTVQSHFRVGQNCIQVDVYNVGGPTALNLQGTLTTSNADHVVNSCCDSTLQGFVPGGSICGVKFNDLNCDGILDFGEPLLPNWKIVLQDNNHSLIDTIQTDSFGTYCFERLAAGTYYVSEVLPANWDQSLPGSPDFYHTINLLRNQGLNADFGNCEETCFVSQNLFIGTGFDFNSMTPYPSGTQDLNWNVLSDPLGNSGISPLVQPYPVPAWMSTQFPSKWITSVNMPSSPNGTYSYELCFCIKDSTQNIAVNFEFRADDSAVIFINGNPVMFVPSGTATSPMPFLVGIPNNFLTLGRNCIQVDVINTNGGATGFSMFGYVSSSNPYNLNHQCCPRGPEPNPSTGFKPMNNQTKPEGSLKQNVPNPTNGSTRIGYFLPESANNAKIEIFDIQGRMVKSITLMEFGESSVTFYTHDIPVGVYIYRLSSNGARVDSKHMIIRH